MMHPDDRLSQDGRAYA